MKRTFGKLITLLLCLTMILSLMPVTALAAPTLDDITDNLPSLEEIGKLPELVATPTPPDPSGACGVSMHWKLSGGVLTISGNGAMYDWSGSEHAPWYANRGSIKTVVIEMGVPSIGNYAFDGLTNLTAVELPASIERIGNYAFEGCTKLAAIELPDSITEIGMGAFENCAALTKVTLPAEIHKAADNLFKGCTALTEVIFPVGETELGASVFDGCTALNMVVYQDVTKIGTGAFRGCTNMTVFNFPDTLTEIGKDAFSGSGLKLVKLPKGLTTVDFLGGTDKLTTVFIPASVKEIANGQFAQCKDLKLVDYEGSKLDWKNIRIEANNDMLQNAEFSYNKTENFLYADVVVTSMPVVTVTPAPTAAPTPTPANTPEPTAAPTPTPVATPNPNLPGGECGENAKWSFDESTGTLTIYGEGETENWGSEENTPWYSYRGKTKTIVIQNGITHIGTSAFRNFQNLTKISLPESLESIGGSVFFDCVRLSTIDIPESVSQIGAQAFYGCELLTEVTIPAKVTILETYLFTDCSELTKVVLPEGVTEIGGHAFSNCKKLTAINLPNSLERIRYRAFYHCTALPALKIPSGVTEIGDAAFSNCDALLQLALPEGIEEVNFISDCTGLKAVYLPKSIVEITSSEFNACKGLTDVYYGGNEADWKDIIVNEGNDYLLNATIHYNASGLPDAPEVTPAPTPEVTPAPTVKPVTTPNPNLPNGKCGENATWEFNTADGTLTIRGEGKMVNEYKTEAGTVVGYGWNKYQSVIKKVVIEDGITHISNDAFKECTGLKEVVMPESVTSIGDMVFWGTWNVEKFTIHPTLAETYYNSVPPYIENLYIYDLEHFLGLYQGKTSAGEYTGNFFTDAKNIYLNDVLLTDLVIPEGFTSVPDSAFSGCNSLKTVTLPDTVTTIGEKAFFECDNLKDVKLSENLKVIEQQAFDSCKSLTSITIPASVEIINERVFSNVKTVIFEGNAPLIAANAFSGVKADAYYPAGNSTWTVEKKENYGGELNWIEGTPTVEPTTTPEPTPVVTPEVTPSVEPTTTPEVTPTVKPTVTPTPTPYVPVEPTVNPELDPETCKHTLFFVAPVEPTCTEEGFTGKVICGNGCGYVLQEGRVKPPLGHSYKKGSCTRCGHIEGTPEPTPTPPVAEGTPFVDMTVNDWFYEPVRWAVENGITGGTSENTFSPDKTCTRAQIVTFLWAVAGKPEPTSKSPFSDVKEGDWFYKPVIWAVENDITSGTTATTFSPNIPCSRAQVVALLYKAVNSPAIENTDNPFTDVLESNYFHKAVLWALENGVASGVTETLFGSSRPCTRAQIATFLYKAYGP